MGKNQCKYMVETGDPESAFDAVRYCVKELGHEGNHVDGYGNEWKPEDWYPRGSEIA